MKGKAFVQSAAGGTAESVAFLRDAVRSEGQPASPRTAPASGPAPGRGWGARGAGEDSSPPPFLGEPLPPPGLAAMSGQSITDRITAAQHSVTGSAVAKAVCKATTHEVMGPKKKHLDCEYGPPAAWGPGRAGLRGALAGVPGGLLGWAGLGWAAGAASTWKERALYRPWRRANRERSARWGSACRYCAWGEWGLDAVASLP